MVPKSVLDTWLEESAVRLRRDGQPLITLSYAQSLDGSIALKRGASLALSGTEAMRMTHQLRAVHDAILVGIGTIESDDPQLNVRYAEGESPTPVILDSHLRISTEARVFHHPKKPVLACLETDAKSEKASTLARVGAIILPVKADSVGHISLPDLMRALHQRGIQSVMVEGGATVIGAFLRQGLVDRAVITIAPVFVGGLKALDNPVGSLLNELLRLKSPKVESVGDDFVIFGEIDG
jgi:GTP cyclohydrolase II